MSQPVVESRGEATMPSGPEHHYGSPELEVLLEAANQYLDEAIAGKIPDVTVHSGEYMDRVETASGIEISRVRGTRFAELSCDFGDDEEDDLVELTFEPAGDRLVPVFREASGERTVPHAKEAEYAGLFTKLLFQLP